MDKNELINLVQLGLSQREISKKTGKSQTSIRYWLAKHSLVTNKKKRFLCGCGETNRNNFYGHKSSICGKCHNAYTLQKGREKRSKIISHMGGCCVNCGFYKWECSLEVHHTDPEKKDPSFSGHRGWSWDRILEEIDGCVLLCGVCHPAVHAGLIDLTKRD
jgi:hypothetical protein